MSFCHDNGLSQRMPAGTELFPTDDELIDAIRSGRTDSDPWSVLITRHANRVLSVTHSFSRDDHSRQKDLSQMIWLKVHQNLYSFQNQSQFSTWLTRIAINTCKDEKKRHAWQAAEETPEIPSHDIPSEDLACMAEAWAAFQKKSPDCFTLLRLYYHYGHTWPEVGKLMNKSPSAVKEQGSQCMKLFRPLAQALCG